MKKQRVIVLFVMGWSLFSWAVHRDPAVTTADFFEDAPPSGQKRRHIVEPIPTEIPPRPVWAPNKVDPQYRSPIIQLGFEEVAPEGPCKIKPEDKNKIFKVVGENHECPICSKRQNEMLYQMVQDSEKAEKKSKKGAKPADKPLVKNPLMALEGMNFQKENGKVAPEFLSLYGVENANVHAFSSVLMFYQTVRRIAATPAEKCKDVAGAMVSPLQDFMQSLAFNRDLNDRFYVWAAAQPQTGIALPRLLAYSKKIKKETEGVVQLTPEKAASLTESVTLDTYDLYPECKDWTAMSEALGKFFLGSIDAVEASVPTKPRLGFQPLRDLVTTKVPTEKEARENFDWHAHLDYIIDWRNDIFVPHLADLFCKAIAEGTGLDFTVGFMHVPGLIPALKKKIVEMGGTEDQVVTEESVAKHDWKKHFLQDQGSMEDLLKEAYVPGFHTSPYDERRYQQSPFARMTARWFGRLIGK